MLNAYDDDDYNLFNFIQISNICDSDGFVIDMNEIITLSIATDQSRLINIKEETVDKTDVNFICKLFNLGLVLIHSVFIYGLM